MRTILFLATFLFTLQVEGQQINWQNLDLEKDSVFGASVEKAYKLLLKDKKPIPVIVAVIDSGIDTCHEDLGDVLWADLKDGAHGRNYMGYESGKEDITRLANTRKDFYDSLSYTRVPEIYQASYHNYRVFSEDYQTHIRNLNLFLNKLRESQEVLRQILHNIGKDQPVMEDIEQYQPANDKEKDILELVKDRMLLYPNFHDLKYRELDHLLQLGEYHLSHGLNVNLPDTEEQVFNNNRSDITNEPLGLVKEPNTTPSHGTHVSGILAAARNNAIGMNGVADNVKIMMLKVVDNIRELRDSSLAESIRFAVDHDAKIINMSLGKPYTLDKNVVDEAVKYAMSRDVLIVHGVGNSGINLDATKSIFYPSRLYENGGQATAWINVGASGPKDDSTLAVSFSNYGPVTVDVFAPGLEIYSTIPHSNYAAWSGTSMATPVVAGIAALIREYYPKLNANQVKEIIMRSVAKREILKEKCVSGGVVNAYNALKLASDYK